MSTYLELCQKAARKCELVAVTGQPTAVTGQSGEMRRIVDYVAEAWSDIQTSQAAWRWMRVGFTVNTVADDDSYAYGDCTDSLTAAAIARFARWWANDRLDAFKIYLQSAGIGTQTRLNWLPIERFDALYRLGSQTSGTPAFVSVDEQNNIVLGPKPNAVFVVTGKYQRGPQTLSADGDTPDMPSRFHDLIVYEVMKKWAVHKSAQELFTEGERGAARLMSDLELDQLPRLRFGGPLA